MPSACTQETHQLWMKKKVFLSLVLLHGFSRPGLIKHLISYGCHFVFSALTDSIKSLCKVRTLSTYNALPGRPSSSYQTLKLISTVIKNTKSVERTEQMVRSVAGQTVFMFLMVFPLDFFFCGRERDSSAGRGSVCKLPEQIHRNVAGHNPGEGGGGLR